MTDRELMLTAAMIALAAGVAVSVAWWVVAVLAVTALVLRHPIALAALAVVLASTLGARAEAGLSDGPHGPVRGWVTLVSDPERGPYSTSAIGRFDDHLVLVEVAAPDPAAVIGPMAAGRSILVSGNARRIDHPTDWHRSRHLAARLDVGSVLESAPADVLWSSATTVRSWLADGSASLGDGQRALFAGLVIGDDRNQSDLQQHAFRASGLAHLLAVSGQNVAFVLLVVSPLTGRLLLRRRFLAIVVVLGWFAVLTRFEPSVLRSVAMAAVAATSMLIGRRSSGLRVLAIAVGGLALIDPLIVWSFGFRLSVGASLGLVLLARRIGNALPGPSWVGVPLGVTLAATAGTAPLLVAAFGVLPVVSPLANLLAVPVAGAVMVWGMTAGVLAGIAPRLAPVLHQPTKVMLWWLDGIARWGADPRWPRLSAVGLAWVVLAVAMLLALRRFRPALTAPAGAAVVLVCVVPMTGVLARPSTGVTALGRGAELVVGDTAAVLVVRPDVNPAGLLDALDAHGASHLDAVVLTRQRSSTAKASALLRRLYGEVPIIAPVGELVDGATVLTGAALNLPLRLGDLDLRPCGDDLEVGPERGSHPLTCPP